MKTFKKRIAFVVMGRHLVSTGGIAQFTKSFIEMAEDLNWAVDIICDMKPPKNSFSDLLRDIACNVYVPSEPRSYNNHRLTYQFFESYNIDMAANFLEATMEAMRKNLYDMVVINAAEGLLPLVSLGIDKTMPIVFYTHNSNMVFADSNKFKDVYHNNFEDMMLRTMGQKCVTVGTQSTRNVEELAKFDINNAHWLPMPISEQALLEEYNGPTDGVLFIGRWETRKNFKEYLRMIKATGLPAKVMTNDKGVPKFTAALEEIGCKFEVRSSIHGDEKCDFIKGSRVYYMPSMAENFPFALMECVSHVPSVVIDKYNWHDNFDKDKIYISKQNDVDNLIISLYNEEPATDITYIQDMNKDIANKWQTFMDNFEPNKANGKASICAKDNLLFSEHITSLNRKTSIDDIISVLNNRHIFNVTQLEQGTWLSKNGDMPDTVVDRVEKEEDDVFDIFFD